MMNYYAAVTGDDRVTAIHRSPHDAGHPDVQAWGRQHRRWVYVEEPCEIGDRLAVEEDGCATVIEDDFDATYTLYTGSNSIPTEWAPLGGFRGVSLAQINRFRCGSDAGLHGVPIRVERDSDGHVLEQDLRTGEWAD